MKEKVTIKIPKELYEKLRWFIHNTGFSSVTEFVTFVIRTILMGGSIAEQGSFTSQEIDEVKSRLKTLGYL